MVVATNVLVAAAIKFCAAMEEAEESLEHAPDAASQRMVAAECLDAVTQFCLAAECPMRPFALLQDALLQLVDGHVAPLFRRDEIAATRPPTGILTGALQGQALWAVREIIKCGEKPKMARTMVAHVLQRGGVRTQSGRGNVTERTIRTWGEMAASDKQSTAAMILRDFRLLQSFADPKEQIRNVLSSLDLLARLPRETR